MVSTIVLAFFVLAVQERAATPVAGDVGAVRALYGSGEYEEALKRLSGPEFTVESTGEVEEYRALCLLALGRVDESTRALEDLARRMPLFKMSESEVSPRLLTMFQDARKRVLPAAAKDLYAKAKADFERQSYLTASTQFGQLMRILADPDLSTADVEGLSDIKMLGDGFRKLADLEVASAAAKAAATAATPTPTGPPVGPSNAAADEKERDAIRKTLQLYAKAYTDRDPRALTEVWPTMPTAVKNAFRDLAKQDTSLRDDSISLQGTKATALCYGQDRRRRTRCALRPHIHT